MKRFLKEGSCEPASGTDNSLPDCCEGVGVLLSEGGNTSAYLATERYRSMPFHLSACHCQNRLVPAKCRRMEQRKSVIHTIPLSAQLLTVLILPSVRGKMWRLCCHFPLFPTQAGTERSSRTQPLNGGCR